MNCPQQTSSDKAAQQTVSDLDQIASACAQAKPLRWNEGAINLLLQTIRDKKPSGRNMSGSDIEFELGGSLPSAAAAAAASATRPQHLSHQFPSELPGLLKKHLTETVLPQIETARNLPKPFYKNLEPGHESFPNYFPTGFWIDKEGRIFVDWRNATLGEGSSKRIYPCLALNEEAKHDDPSEYLKACWDWKPKPAGLRSFTSNGGSRRGNSAAAAAALSLNSNSSLSGVLPLRRLGNSGAAITRGSQSSETAANPQSHEEMKQEYVIQKLVFDHAKGEIHVANPGTLIEVGSSNTIPPRLHVVQPFYPGGSLDGLFTHHSVSNNNRVNIAGQLAGQLIEQLYEMHSLDVVHSDMKPENILLSENKHLLAQISDFGNALIVGPNTEELHEQPKRLQRWAEGYEGTALFNAPERNALAGESTNLPKLRRYAKKNDVWALGLVLYWLLLSDPKSHEGLPQGCRTGADNVLDHMTKMSALKSQGDLCRICKLFCDKEGKATVVPTEGTLLHLIYQMLNPDPEKRPSMDQVRSIFMQHRSQWESVL